MEKEKVFEILKNVKKNKQMLSLWTFKFDELVEVDTWISEINPDNLKIGFLTKRFKVAEAIIGSRTNIFLYSPELRIAFATKLMSLVGNELYVTFPHKSEIIELRQDIRLDMDLRFQLNIKGKMYNFDTFDIGYNGISIIVKESMKPLFKKGMEIDECYLFLADKKVKIKAQVRNFVKMAAYEYSNVPYAFFRIGMEFQDMGDKKKEFIRRVIDSKKVVG